MQNSVSASASAIDVLSKLSFEEILNDLSSRFIINVPDEELSSVERICFQVEQAHWFYEDFIRELNPKLPSFQLKTFSANIFSQCTLLQQWNHVHDQAYADFMQYRFRIPVCGAIILNDNLDKCVLVKGWSSKSGWGFPKGKINQEEECDSCAIREVLEETGYDIQPLLKENDYIELTIREQRIRLYIIQGVPEDTQFLPRTRKEISQISWIKLNDLPTFEESRPGNSMNYVKSGSYRFYMVVPFIVKLRRFLEKNSRRVSQKSGYRKQQSPLVKSAGPADGLKQLLGVHDANGGVEQPLRAISPDETADELKRLLGMHDTNGSVKQPFIAASPAVSQPQPEHPPNIGNNMLQQLFASSKASTSNLNLNASSPPQQQRQFASQSASQPVSEPAPQQHNDILQRLQQAHAQQQQQQHQESENTDIFRRGSLLNALNGKNSNDITSIEAHFRKALAEPNSPHHYGES